MKPYLVEMVRRPTPSGCSVVSGSTPVVAFGNPELARVATVGINPSVREFRSTTGWLDGPKRRLATLVSLNASSTDTLTDTQVAQVVTDCDNYFHRNPYGQWFNPLNTVLHDGLGVSYFDDSACHLDLVQWATEPVWSKIPDPQIRKQLLDDGVAHLRTQLQKSAVDTVVVNGDAVWRQLIATELVTISNEERLAYGNGPTVTTLRTGEGPGVRYFGWTLNLQSSFGVRTQDRVHLASWLRDATRDRDAHVSRTVVHSRAEFAAVLARWHATSGAPTIGDVGTYGRRWILHFDLGDGRAVSLNADTTRDAVEQYLQIDQGLPWHVRANRNGRINKVDFTNTGSPTAGWYAYLNREASTEGPL